MEGLQMKCVSPELVKRMDEPDWANLEYSDRRWNRWELPNTIYIKSY